MNENTKLCKHCKTEIPKDAKICPNCRKKQKGIGKWIVLAIIIILIIAIASCSSGKNKDTNPEKVSSGTSQSDTAQTSGNSDAGSSDASSDNDSQNETSNVFHVGDVVETESLRISYLSAGEYVSDDEFDQPKDGYVYWKFEFAFENISNHDEVVSSLMDWECYADNAKVDSAWILGNNNGLDATLSSGRTTQGTIYYEVPENAQAIELEYDINYFSSNKIIFMGK